MSRSQELFDAFLSGYKPALPQALVDQYNAVKEMKLEIGRLDEKIRELRAFVERRSQLITKVNRNQSQYTYSEERALDPQRIYEDMKEAVTRQKAIFDSQCRSDSGSLFNVYEVLNGRSHAIDLICAWAPVGADIGDQIYKALLEEAGISQEAVERKYQELTGSPINR